MRGNAHAAFDVAGAGNVGLDWSLGGVHHLGDSRFDAFVGVLRRPMATWGVA